MLGGLRVIQSDRTITRFQTQKTGALLAYLALDTSVAHPREVLAELLWPGADPVAVRNRLNQAVSSLRRQLEPPGVIHGSVLVTDQRTIRLNPESIETDTGEFLRMIQAAETTDIPEEKKAYLKRAVDLYSGEFLKGIYAEWATLEQLRLADSYSGALFDLLEASRDTDDLDLAIRAATLLLKDDPTDEGTHCDLMQLYIDAGRPTAAKRQFEELARILSAEGETPSDEAINLQREASAKRSSAPKAPRVVVPPSTPVSVPLAPEPTPVLPLAPNRFVGREHDLERLKAMLTDADVRLVTITGVGGCGKTRLALQTASNIQADFQGCTYFVPLADLQDARQIEESIASALGIVDPANVAKRIRQNESTLLILDNFEHLVADGAKIIQSLLDMAPRLKCLVTSRRPIRIEIERCYSLAPLPSPSETSTIEELMVNPSVALFVDRAQASLPDFQLTNRNFEVIRLLAERLEGLPLAIELAASWAKTVSPGQMLALLTDRFALLESRRRDISPRHRTMLAVIDSSVNMLPPEQKTLFLRLSVFNGGWSLDAAAEVCQKPDVLRAMEGLMEQSLIQSEDSDPDETRFRMLDTMRDYAADHLPASDQAETQNLHATYFSKLAERGSEAMRSSEQPHWTVRLDSEYANLAAAFHWYLEHHLVESALALSANLAEFWEFRGRTREGRRWIETCLAALDAEHTVSPRILVNAKTRLSRLMWIRGDFEQAARYHMECLEAWNQLNDSRGIVYAQINLQQEAHRTRNYGRSVELLQDNLRRAKALEDKYLLARTWIALGNTSVELRKFDDAQGYYEQSLTVAREAENRHRIAHALNNLGNLALIQGRHDLARHHLAQALNLFEEIGAKPLATGAMLILAKLERRAGDYDASRAHLDRAWLQNPEETYHVQMFFLENAHLAVKQGKSRLAATLLGFVESQHQVSGALNYDVEQEEFEKLKESVFITLPIDKVSEAWALGRTLEPIELAQMIAS